MNIINWFSREDTIFRKYPELTITQFHSIAILFAIFESIREKYIPNLPTNALACRLQDQIDEFRYLNVFNRLDGIVLQTPCASSVFHHAIPLEQETQTLEIGISCKSKPNNIASNVITRNYQPNGYNTNNFIDCEQKYCNVKLRGGKCITDQNSSYQYHQANDKCAIEYMELLRHRIENAYDKSKNAPNEICTENVRSQRNTTGYGWLKIIFTSAKGERLPSGRFCDSAGFIRLSHCDLYIDLSINGQHEYSTQVIEGNEVAFFELYQSKKISKNQSYEIKLNDEDVRSNDTLITTTGKIDHLTTEYYHRMALNDNYFDMVVYWRDEYEDEN